MNQNQKYKKQEYLQELAETVKQELDIVAKSGIISETTRNNILENAEKELKKILVNISDDVYNATLQNQQQVKLCKQL